LNKAKDLLLAGDLGAEDFRDIKKETEKKIANLHQLLADLNSPADTVYKTLKKYDKVLLDLAFLYERASVAGKRKLITFLFPDNLIYTCNGFTIPHPGVVLKLIYLSIKVPANSLI
jgi:site-specific DNA recombinase